MVIDKNLGMDWKCEARTDHLDDEICELMAKTNCNQFVKYFHHGAGEKWAS